MNVKVLKSFIGIALVSMVTAAWAGGAGETAGNPCGLKAHNPCGKVAENPCNPCGKSAANPCARSSLVDYSDASFAQAAEDRRVLFFHAPWCPSCVASASVVKHLKLPEDVKVFKVDYDSSGDLKRKYGVVHQDTFVQVDGKGNKIAQWSGGARDLLGRLK